MWIERDDFAEVPPKGFFRLFPGNKVRLKYGVVIECTGCTKNAAGEVVEVLAAVVPDTRSGTPGADRVKVKGTITWVGVHDAMPAELRLYDRLFTEPQPDAGGRDFKASLNPASKRVVQRLPRTFTRRPGPGHAGAVRAPRLLRDGPRRPSRRRARCSTASPG